MTERRGSALSQLRKTSYSHFFLTSMPFEIDFITGNGGKKCELSKLKNKFFSENIEITELIWNAEICWDTKIVSKVGWDFATELNMKPTTCWDQGHSTRYHKGAQVFPLVSPRFACTRVFRACAHQNWRSWVRIPDGADYFFIIFLPFLFLYFCVILGVSYNLKLLK